MVAEHPVVPAVAFLCFLLVIHYIQYTIVYSKRVVCHGSCFHVEVFFITSFSSFYVPFYFTIFLGFDCFELSDCKHSVGEQKRYTSTLAQQQ